MRSRAAQAMTQEAFSEYHLYTLGRRTTIANQETKQLALLNGTGVPVEKRYVVDGQSFYYRNRHSPARRSRTTSRCSTASGTTTKSGLGSPMPAGVVRVYQADSKGGLQFVGEDRIDHTPKDETLDLKIGNAFDIVCERNQTDFEKIGDMVYEMEFAITLRNHKTTPIVVQVNEPVGGTWQMLRSTHEWQKTAAWASQFTVPVPADGAATLKYRVRVHLLRSKLRPPEPGNSSRLPHRPARARRVIEVTTAMFDPAIYRARRNRLKKDVGSGLILLLGNDEVGMNYAANTYHFRQDSTFLYFFAVDLPGLAAVIDVDQGTETLFGDDLTVADIVWTGPQPTIADKRRPAGIAATAPMAELEKRICRRPSRRAAGSTSSSRTAPSTR